ncbi:MAG: DUF3750 domain-containing protein [Rhodospirillaceae bacterium]|jgi:hypothetical protein
MRKCLRISCAAILLVLIAAAIGSWGRVSVADWRTASREPAGIAPDPAITQEAIVQVYGARAYSWRGTFGVHTWIAVKPTGAPAYTVYEVIGWRAYYDEPVLAISERAPDARWFGNVPEVFADLRGDGVDDVIKRIDKIARSYPYVNSYSVWPGPNSNTFTAFVARDIPELKLDLPPTAIGKDYLTNGSVVSKSPSGTGFQFSLFGLLGVLAGVEEGVELNFLGLTFGLDPLDLSLKLPIVGRVGPKTSSPPARLPEQI